MKGKDIENLVIVKLEEYSPYNPSTDGPLVAGGDVLDEIKPIYSYVSQHLAEAANEVLMVAPLGRLTPKKCSFSPVEDYDDMTIGKILLPLDYLRVHTYWMQDWLKPVHYSAKFGDPVDNMQNYKWTRGTHIKPIVVEDGERGYPYEVRETSCIDTEDYIAVEEDALIKELPIGLSNLRIMVYADGHMQLVQFYKYIESTSYITLGMDDGNVKFYYKEYKDGRLYWEPNDSGVMAITETTIGSTAILDDDESTEVEIVDKHVIYDVDINKDEPFEDGRYLRYYSTKGNHDLKEFLYIPVFSEEQEYMDKVAELIALNCAKKVCEVFERTESLTIINNEMQAVLQNLGL